MYGLKYVILNAIIIQQVIKTFSMKKLVAYRIGKAILNWCQKEGNKGLIRRGNV